MKQWCRKSLFALATFAPLTAMTGCVVRAYPAPVAGEVTVNEAPPAEQTEVVGVAPGPDYIWIGGYWGFVGGRWVWTGGHWGRRPHPGAVWVAGNWEHRGGHYVWHEGRWR